MELEMVWIELQSARIDAELWCFFDLSLNIYLTKQSWGWWFETPSPSLWRHCNAEWTGVPDRNAGNKYARWVNDLATAYETKAIPYNLKWRSIIRPVVVELQHPQCPDRHYIIVPFTFLQKDREQKCIWNCHLQNGGHFILSWMC